MPRKQPLLFTTASYEYLRDAIVAAGDVEAGSVVRKRFPDGELYQRIVDDVSFRDVIIVGGTISDADTLEIYDLACVFVKSGAESLTMVVPYFGYSTMDRAVAYGEVVTAKTRARLFSAIPIAHRGNCVALLDLHADGLAYYFEGALSAVHVTGREVIKRAIVEEAGSHFVLACTDAGRAKWVQSLADDMGVHASFVFKRRLDGERTELTAVSAHVEGEDVVIYDDMIRTGSSLITAGRAYREAGARSVTAVATHGVLPADALDRLRESGLFRKVVVTDSHPRANELACDFLRVVSVGPLLARAIGDRSYAVVGRLD